MPFQREIPRSFRRNILCALLLFAATAAHAEVFARGGPATTNNDDTCDIAVTPAATLLLPFFDVDLNAPRGTRQTTLVTITNVANTEQIAHVTLWTDRAYPVIAFDVYLTGYDVQSIDLYDVLALGRIAPPNGTGTAFPDGDFSSPNTALDVRNCVRIPPALPESAVTRLRSAFTRGEIGDCKGIGRNYGRAFGYATIDVVSACGSPLTPRDAAYYEGLLRYDNVLTGEYVHVNPSQGTLAASPLVHIRAVPEGEDASTRAAFPETFTVNLPRTFYSRFQGGRKTDARQPLPSRFVLPWMKTNGVRSEFVLWHEPELTDGSCASYRVNERINSSEVILFDEDENAMGTAPWDGPLAPPPPPGWDDLRTPVTSRVRYDSAGVPEFDDAAAGWAYVNLDDDYAEGTSQGWIVAVRRTASALVHSDAIPLGNGCTPATGSSEINPNGTVVIAPSPNQNGRR